MEAIELDVSVVSTQTSLNLTLLKLYSVAPHSRLSVRKRKISQVENTVRQSFHVPET